MLATKILYSEPDDSKVRCHGHTSGKYVVALEAALPTDSIRELSSCVFQRHQPNGVTICSLCLAGEVDELARVNHTEALLVKDHIHYAHSYDSQQQCKVQASCHVIVKTPPSPSP